MNRILQIFFAAYLVAAQWIGPSLFLHPSSSPDPSAPSAVIQPTVDWIKKISLSTDSLSVRYVRPVPSGGFVVVGTQSIVYNLRGYRDVLLVRLSASGDLVWSKTYGKIDASEGGMAVAATADGFIIAASKYKDTLNYSTTYTWLFATDLDGKMLWEKNIQEPGSSMDQIKSIVPGGNNTYVLSGISNVHPWMLKINGSGDILLDQTYNLTGDSYESDPTMNRSAETMIMTADNGFLLAGVVSEYSAPCVNLYGYFLLKTDAAGQFVWSKWYYNEIGWLSGGSCANAYQIRAVVEAADGSYYLTGSGLNSSGTSEQPFTFLMHTDAAGTRIGQTHYFGDRAGMAIVTGAGKITAVGSYDSTGYRVYQTRISGFSPTFLQEWTISPLSLDAGTVLNFADMLVTDSGAYVIIGTPKETGSLFISRVSDPNLPVPARTPVIFLPGIMGSHLYNGDEKMWFDMSRTLGLCLTPWSPADCGLSPLKLAQDGKSALTSKYGAIGTRDGLDGLLVNIPLGPANKDIYGKLVKHFEDQGYQLGVDFFVFPYDWRKDLADETLASTMARLDALVNQASSLNANAKVALVAHSMGGLVARQFVTSTPARAGKIEQIITLGTPYLGTPKALAALMGLSTIIEPLPVIINNTLYPSVGLPSPEVTKTMAENFPGFYELLPSETYFRQKGGGIYSNAEVGSTDGACPTCLNYTETYSKSTLKNLNTDPIMPLARAFHAGIDEQTGWGGVPKVTIIYGVGKQTISGIAMRRVLAPSPFPPFALKVALAPLPLTNLNGDGTVTTLSSTLTGAADLRGHASITAVVEEHGGLVENDYVLGLLQVTLAQPAASPLPGAALTPAAAAPDLSGTQIIASGAAALHITDALGKHTGPVAETDGIEMGIPGSQYYYGDGIVSVALPAGQAFTITVTPSGVGAVDLSVLRTASDGSQSSRVFAGIAAGKAARIVLAGDPYSQDNWMLDADGSGQNLSAILPTSSTAADSSPDLTPPSATVDLEGQTSAQGWYQGLVKVTITAQDNETGVQRVNYLLSNSQQMQTYSGPFVVDAAQVSLISVVAVDNAGNMQAIPVQVPLGPVQTFLPALSR